MIELKIWGRNDYLGILAQVSGYWASTTRASAAVMITDVNTPSWASVYARDCLGGCAAVSPLPPSPPLLAAFEARSSTADGLEVCVEHHLLRLPRA